LSWTITTTTTNKATYPSKADAIAGTNANPNPVVLAADGRPEVEVWITGQYRLRTYTSTDVLIADDDVIEVVLGASDAQSNAPTYGGNHSGTATALAFTFAPALTEYKNGQVLRGRITASSAGPFTVNCNGLGVKSLVDGAGNAIAYLAGPNQIEFMYDSATDVLRLTSGNNAMLLGTHTIQINAASMFSRTTNGAAAGLTELATNDVMLASKDFDQTTSEGAQFYITAPKSSQESTLTFQAGWTAASGTGTFIVGFRALAVGNDDAMDAAFGTGVTVTDTLLTANDMHVTDVSAAVTPSGTWAEGDTLIVEVYRDISDTLNADAKLIWVKAFLTLIAGNDA
jgi:hypothetical protein